MMASSGTTFTCSEEQLAQIVAAVKSSMHDEIQSLKRELLHDEAAEERLVKRARLQLKEGPVFKKSLEKRLDFNTESKGTKLLKLDKN